VLRIHGGQRARQELQLAKDIAPKRKTGLALKKLMI